jgi:hypothetical protein
MRTNIVLNDRLRSLAMRLSAVGTQRERIETALPLQHGNDRLELARKCVFAIID